MAKTIETKEITPEMREDYLRAIGKALYSQPSMQQSYDISSSSKGGDPMSKKGGKMGGRGGKKC